MGVTWRARDTSWSNGCIISLVFRRVRCNILEEPLGSSLWSNETCTWEAHNRNANFNNRRNPRQNQPVQDKNLLRDQMWYPLQDNVQNQGRTPPLHVDEVTERLILITLGITCMILWEYSNLGMMPNGFMSRQPILQTYQDVPPWSIQQPYHCHRHNINWRGSRKHETSQQCSRLLEGWTSKINCELRNLTLKEGEHV